MDSGTGMTYHLLSVVGYSYVWKCWAFHSSHRYIGLIYCVISINVTKQTQLHMHINRRSQMLRSLPHLILIKMRNVLSNPICRMSPITVEFCLEFCENPVSMTRGQYLLWVRHFWAQRSRFICAASGRGFCILPWPANNEGFADRKKSCDARAVDRQKLFW